MVSQLSQMLSMEGKDLRNRLSVIALLVLVLPFIGFSYILYREGIFTRLDYSYTAIVVLLLFLSLSGLIILRQVFDKFMLVALFMKKAEAGEMAVMEVHRDTAELKEICTSFNGIVKRLEETTKWLEDQTLELKKATDERLQAEEALWGAKEELRESEKMFETITSAANDAIITMDEEANIAYWNPAAERMFGYQREEAVGRNLHELLVPERFHGDFLKGFERFRETGEGPVIGKTLGLAGLRKDGTEFHAEHSIAAVKIKGRWHAVGVIRDVSERKKLEDELKQRLNDLEQMNRLMVDRELRMEEMKKEIKRLKERVKGLEKR